MSVIIRLQNLPWTANALDIRRFFSGLSIPDGGVHIVGGDKGDAFIAFSTDEDARRAMLMDNGRLSNNVIKLLLSSKTEMQNVIAVARGGSTPAGPQGGQPGFNQPAPQQTGPPMNQQTRYGPAQGNEGFGPPGGYNNQNMGMQQQGPPNNMNNDQRHVMYGAPQTQAPQMHGRPGDRPNWDQPSNQGNFLPRDAPVDYGRRDMPYPRDVDRGRDVPPSELTSHDGYDRGIPTRNGGNMGGYDNGMDPVNGGGPMMDRRNQGPPPDYRDEPRQREYRNNVDYRPPSPRVEHGQYNQDVTYDRREDNRKRPYDNDAGGPFIFITNMPRNINYRDVRQFFHGLEIPRDGLKLINDEYGQRIGDAYVRFQNVHYANEALKFNGYTIRDHPVRIHKASFEDYDRAVDSYVPAVVPDLERVRRYDGGFPPRGEPQIKRKRSISPSGFRKGDSKCVVVKNLPYDMEKRELFKFFSGLRFAKGDASVHLELGAGGKPKGIALIEFNADKDVNCALTYHGTKLGGRPIEVISITFEEYNARISKYLPENKASDAPNRLEKSIDEDKEEPSKEESKQSEKSPEKKENKDATNDRKISEDDGHSQKRYFCVEMKGLPYSAHKGNIKQFFTGLSIAPRGIHMLYKSDGSVSGTAFVEFVSAEDCKSALERDKDMMGKRYIDIRPVTKLAMMEACRNGPRRNHPSDASSPSVARQVGKQGFVVGLKNIHFNTTLEDILDFFHGFHPIADSVKMRYGPNGVPTGDAIVAFHTREDADHAVQVLNRRRMHERLIDVFHA